MKSTARNLARLRVSAVVRHGCTGCGYRHRTRSGPRDHRSLRYVPIQTQNSWRRQHGGGDMAREHTKCRFVFTRVRADLPSTVSAESDQCTAGCCRCLQLSEIRLENGAGQRLTPTSVYSAGSSPPAEGPDQSFDNATTTKWLDLGYAASSTTAPSSVLELEANAKLKTYEIVTAADATYRDPVEWTVHCWTTDDASGEEIVELADHFGAPLDAPTARLTSYGVRTLHPLTPPSPPPFVPRAPPSSPPPPARDGALRLRGDAAHPPGASSSSRTGTLEVFHAGEWGTICDDRFTLLDGRVACRQLLGSTHAAAELLIPSGTGLPIPGQRIWMDALGCVGTEARLDECKFGGCVYLPISPHTSQHLPTSPHISPLTPPTLSSHSDRCSAGGATRTVPTGKMSTSVAPSLRRPRRRRHRRRRRRRRRRRTCRRRRRLHRSRHRIRLLHLRDRRVRPWRGSARRRCLPSSYSRSRGPRAECSSAPLHAPPKRAVREAARERSRRTTRPL